ncbi:lysozyme inhibitor LprI family protein [Paraburkholderia sp. BCC1885]|uniref:lysozyme inhibitor LprI family protein n=1 Tax=Paraburkholderia sp. BCC1885 TaxID=2562669 RepID=UPI0011827F9C|nr:hypothetical protein [Paraburkholderia sp. BCC1885]
MKISRTALLASLLLTHLPAHATSFDCSKGRSRPEQLICHQPDLSRLDDQLGKLYWQARRSVADPKAFRTDSDSKWAWREANCTDEACLKTWYSGRIAELQRLLAGLPQSAPARQSNPDDAPPRPREITRDPQRRALARAALQNADDADAAANVSATATLQCTAAEPGIVLHEQCATVLKEDARWQYPARNGDWFCGLANLPQAPAEPIAQQ